MNKGISEFTSSACMALLRFYNYTSNFFAEFGMQSTLFYILALHVPTSLVAH